MRLIAALILSLLFSAHAIATQSGEEQTNNQADGNHVLDGRYDGEQLEQQFEQIIASGLDTSKKYKWEFRFTSNIMSSLEDFAQYSHILGFWPVALEKDVTGEMYWLYIQKEHQYTKEQFVKEVTALFNMAEDHKLDRYDGFSIDHVQKKSQAKDENKST